MKETFVLFSSTFAGIRYQNKMRLRFLQYLRRDLEAQGYKCLLWEEKKNGIKLYNLVVGNILKAKKIIVAGYDTPSKTLVPNFLYYPLDNDKNRKFEKKEILIKLMISLFLISLGAILIYKIPSFSFFLKVLGIFILVVLLYFSFYLIKGFGNFYNFNKNSGALAISYELIKQMNPKDENVAVIFLDQVATSYLGYFYLKKILEEKKTPTEIIILDCVAAGETTFFVSEASYRKEVENLNNFFPPKNKLVVLLNKEEIRKTPLSLFKNAIYITSGEMEGKDIVVRNTRSKKDIAYDLGKMELLKDCLYQYCFDK